MPVPWRSTRRSLAPLRLALATNSRRRCRFKKRPCGSSLRARPETAPTRDTSGASSRQARLCILAQCGRPWWRRKIFSASSKNAACGRSAAWWIEMATVARPCAALIRMSSAACVRYSMRPGDVWCACGCIRSRTSRKHSTPRSAGTEYSISLKRFSRTVGKIRQLSSTRSRSALARPAAARPASLGSRRPSAADRSGLSVLVNAQSSAGYQKNSKCRFAAIRCVEAVQAVVERLAARTARAAGRAAAAAAARP